MEVNYPVMTSCRIVSYCMDSPHIKSVLGGNDKVDVIYARSGYEAAAEILAAPAAAIVLKLEILSKRHVGLLNIARRMGLEIIGVGASSGEISLGAEELSRVRLISISDLGEEIERIVSQQDQTSDTGKEEYIPRRQTSPQPRQESSPGEEAPAAEQTEPELPPAAVDEPPQKTPRGEPGHNEQRRSAHGILTSEEISALLKDREK